jgi:transcriptional regulator with PAS, ATPase and Fis domain
LYIRENHDEIIKKSFERSVKYGVKKGNVLPKKVMSEKEIQQVMKKNSEFIKTASTFIDIIYDFLTGSGFFIVLADSNGCILGMKGDEEILEAARKINMRPGFCMDEKSIGTNAIGIAITEDMPIQVSASEHFINAYHRWTCSAAPIHDENGKIIGVLNLTGSSICVYPHTLGLVVAAVKSIENKMKSDAAQNELVETYEYINTIMHTITSGIFAVDASGMIKFINKSACQMLNMDIEDAINSHVGSFLKNWDDIFTLFESGQEYQDEEITIENGPMKERYMISAYPIKTKDGRIIGMVVLIDEIKKVMNLVSKYTGMRGQYTFDDIIGESRETKRIIEYAKAIANSPSTVLITGESGTGKEILAQSIHNCSDRRDFGFIAINCGAIPENLIESELFGYDEGAFTGAKKGGHPGKFELANGGTIFLDEIGEMPLDMQVSLLRVLQEGYITRVGGTKPIPVDVRVIAATNKDLKEEIAKGKFREDLYYRLSVIPINIAPLRERKDDIPPLIDYFLNKKAAKLSKSVPKIGEELYRKLLNYDWPGNVRELENVIENIVNFDGKTTYSIDNKPGGLDMSNRKATFGRDYSLTLDDIERDSIVSYLRKFKGNISRAASVLGISRNTLYCKIKKYGIDHVRYQDSV